MLETIRAARLIPVLTIPEVAHAVPLARALVAGGVRVLEITLRTPAGAGAAAAIRREVPEAVVGLGTVLTDEDLALAQDLDLPFAFSPGATPALLDAAVRRGVFLVPGIATAAELMTGMEREFALFKLFPAEQAGGTGMLKSLGGPFPEARFCPTGGVTLANAPEYLKLANVVAVGGSWLAPVADVAAGNWAAIEGRARAAMAALG